MFFMRFDTEMSNFLPQKLKSNLKVLSDLLFLKTDFGTKALFGNLFLKFTK